MSHQGALCFISDKKDTIYNVRLPDQRTVQAYVLNVGTKIGWYIQNSKCRSYAGVALDKRRRCLGRVSAFCQKCRHGVGPEGAQKGFATALWLSSQIYDFLTGKRGGAGEKAEVEADRRGLRAAGAKTREREPSKSAARGRQRPQQ